MNRRLFRLDQKKKEVHPVEIDASDRMCSISDQYFGISSDHCVNKNKAVATSLIHFRRLGFVY